MKLKNIFVVFLSFLIFSSIGFSVIAHADDDEEEEKIEHIEDEDEDEDVRQDVVSSESVVKTENSNESIKESKTIVIPASTILVNELKTFTFMDSDRDGLIDNQDPHPNIVEIYFVKDENLNGIVDSFEY